MIALAIFPGEKPQPHHKIFEEKDSGCRILYEFNVLDVHEFTEEELFQQDTPIALALLASKRAIKTRNQPGLRYAYKKELLLLARSKNYPVEKTKGLINFVFFVMKLPTDLDKQLITEVLEELNQIKDMTTSTVPLADRRRAKILFKVIIEKTTGKPYSEYEKEQRDIKRRLALAEKQALALERNVRTAEKQALKLEQLAEKQALKLEKSNRLAELERRRAIIKLAKILSIDQIAQSFSITTDEVERIIDSDRKPS